MATTKHEAYQTLVSAATLGLGTALNSLANAGLVTGAEYDNTTGLAMWADFYLVLGTQTARSAGAYVALFVVPSPDGTNYPDIQISCIGGLERGIFPLDAATTARSVAAVNVPMQPGKQKLICYNATGQAFAASGNSITMRLHNLATA